MSEQTTTLTQDEKVLAALAHGSILLGLLTNGVGGVVAALVLWLTQKDKSAYAAFQALQALVYQVATFLVTMLAWCCWIALFLALLMPPIMANPKAYENAPPPGMWAGLLLMAVPFAIWGVTILYGLWGAVRCLSGHDFRYVIIGKWLENQR